MLLAGCFVPADELVPALHLPGCRTQARAGHEPIVQPGHILEIGPDDRRMTGVMVLVPKGVPTPFVLGVADLFTMKCLIEIENLAEKAYCPFVRTFMLESFPGI